MGQLFDDERGHRLGAALVADAVGEGPDAGLADRKPQRLVVEQPAWRIAGIGVVA